MDWYKQAPDEAIKQLNSSKMGLKDSEAKNRLGKYGPNIIEQKHEISRIKIFLNQFKNFLVIILIIAAAISGFLGEVLDATVIILIVVANSFFGYFQEFKAERAIEALKKLTTPTTHVLRDGKIREIPAEQVVPGDILILEEGAVVPADSRIIEQFSLRVNEASLTGESTPVSKRIEVVQKANVIAEMKNMLWMGTTITGGKCKALVVSTGMKTEMGKIAEEIQVETEETPLQKKLGYLGKQLGIMILIIAALISIAGVLILKSGILEMFETGVALAVAAIPEGLPAVATLTLALGIRTMSSKNAIVRRLPAVETLGSTTVICSDKTGTLTKNEMAITKLYLPDKIIEPNGLKTHNSTSFLTDSSKRPALEKDSGLLLKIGALCNNAEIDNGQAIGDPTEVAILKISESYLGKKKNLESKEPLVTEIPFSSERKMMTIVRSAGFKNIAYTKGAVEIILERCSKIEKCGKTVNLTTLDKKTILQRNRELTSQALRVLAFAYRDVSKVKLDEKSIEKDLVFVGMMGMIDPPRDEVKDAIKLCNKAGIRVVMITGDHANTAGAIAKEIGITGDVITGEELDKMSEDKLVKVAGTISVYARVSPHHKSKILGALKEQGHIVAMTGDGVNDATALKKSDIGVSMGITGTDVAKEASDMVLKDDNFSSIVVAVKEGRVIYDNIKKFVQLLLSANLAEVLIVALSVFIGFQFGGEFVIPLTAIQILWINLVTDGLPALALGIDPGAKNIMDRKPRDPKEKILNKNMFLYIMVVGVMITVMALYAFSIVLPHGVDKARTIIFTNLVMFELLLAYAIRRNYGVSMFTNKYLFLAIISSIILQLAVVYIPFLQPAFQTVALGLTDWVYVLAGPIVLFLILYAYATFSSKES